MPVVCGLVHAVSAISDSKNTNVLFIERYYFTRLEALF